MNQQNAEKKSIVPDWPVIGFMFAVHVVAIAALPYFSLKNLMIAVVLWFVTGCLGITLGYHRLLSHRSFKVPKWLERIFATCGLLAIQSGPVLWVGHHRMHHAGSDTPKDPHNARRGFWYSHILWLFEVKPLIDDPAYYRKFARDIYADPYYRLFEKPAYMISLQVILAGILFLIGGWSAVGWGIFVRLVFGYHATWLVNSATHKWGYRNYEVNDLSRNTWWVALITFGEGWHNNHHTFGDVCRSGHKWWEIDVTWYVIWTLKQLGLAKDIVPVPSKEEKLSLRPTRGGGANRLAPNAMMKKK